MHEDQLVSGVCPKCGNPLQIPGALEHFSCLYCGARLSLGELLPQAPAPAAVNEAEIQEAYDYVAANLLECVTAYPNAFRHLTRQEFEPYFQNYLAACRPVFQRLPMAAMAQLGGTSALASLADGFLTQLEGWAVKSKRGLTSRDAMLEDAKYTICLLLIPGIRSLGDPACEEFCRLLREQWLARYPRKVFQLTTYEEIVEGFQHKRLCFITTAVCRQSGKPDDCPELTAFRAFRDGYLQAQPDGPALIRQYYDLAPGIVTAISLVGRPEDVYPAIWSRYLSPCYEAIGRGEPARCKQTYIQMVRDLAGEYLGLSL